MTGKVLPGSPLQDFSPQLFGYKICLHVFAIWDQILSIDDQILQIHKYAHKQIQKYKVLKGPNMWYIFEKHGIEGYKIWHSVYQM